MHASFRLARLHGRRPLQVLVPRHARAFCAMPPCPWKILNLSNGAPRSEIKRAYYELAKQCHPDVVGGSSDECSSDGPNFLDIQAAFEILIHEDDERSRGGSEMRNGVRVRTAPSSAERGGERASGGRSRRPGAKVVHDRERALGEVLCDRLQEEPDGEHLEAEIRAV